MNALVLLILLALLDLNCRASDDYAHQELESQSETGSTNEKSIFGEENEEIIDRDSKNRIKCGVPLVRKKSAGSNMNIPIGSLLNAGRSKKPNKRSTDDAEPISIANGPGFLEDSFADSDVQEVGESHADSLTDGEDSQSRIVGGEVVRIENWPWQVSLRRNSQHLCGGSLINKHWIITAAHCFVNSRNPDDYIVAMGKTKKFETETGEQMRQVSHIIIHSQYGSGKKNNNDIALLRLASPVSYSSKVLPICLPEKDAQLEHNRECFVTGYGATKGTGGDGLLKMAKVKHIALDTCSRLSRSFERSLTENMICAGVLEGGTDSCQGDSGGPLVVESRQSNQYVLYGLTSFGFGCAAPQKSGVYTKLSNFLDWIMENAIETRATI